jgi:NADH:ubiquinone oxidoreductase subunit F (NADH-binding)
LIGKQILGTEFSFEVEVRSGAGGYVLGEESVLLNGIEGWRSVPRTRPPFPTEAGLWASPTVINNVETLCNVPRILRDGVESYRQDAGPNGSGTKLVSLSGAVKRPGLVEIAMGTSLKDVVFEIGGGAPDGRRIVGVLAGGPSGGFLSLDGLDTAARPGALTASGAVLGSGGIVVLDETMPIVEIVRHLTEYNRDESCGKCTPCREGTDHMLEILTRAANGSATAGDLERLLFLGEVATSASLCGLGQMAPNPITSAVDQFGEQLRAAFQTG